MQFKKIIAPLIIVLLLPSCSRDPDNQDIGTITGAVVGGIVGNQIGDGQGKVVATGIGVMVGSIIGGNIGASMDEVNRMKMSQALENTKTNHSRSWVDPNTNTKYIIKPTKTTDQNNVICRNFTMSVVIDGKIQVANGVACRDPKGNWVIQK